MLFIAPTHAIWSVFFIPSVTSSAAFICLMISSRRFCACSFKSARYVHSSPLRHRSLKRTGLFAGFHEYFTIFINGCYCAFSLGNVHTYTNHLHISTIKIRHPSQACYDSFWFVTRKMRCISNLLKRIIITRWTADTFLFGCKIPKGAPSDRLHLIIIKTSTSSTWFDRVCALIVPKGDTWL